MAESMRLPQGGLIDRDTRLNFTFNGRQYTGYQGDTLASALLANGVRLVGRSFKYHRPRGVMGAGIEETNALVQLLHPRDEPNVQATRLPLTDGLAARSINCWPSVGFDLGAVNSLLSPLFPAGFYYKTFMWRPWKEYARVIRRFAGLGNNPVARDHGHYERRYHHCDLLIVGSGPAGLAAALAAARADLRVMLVDDGERPGGDLLNLPRTVDGGDGEAWARESAAWLDSRPNVLRLNRSLVAGYYDHNLLTAVERVPDADWVAERLWRIRAGRVILATGSVERPLLFPGNDRPGVMLASAAAAYCHRYGVRPGRAAAVATNNNSAYAAAFALRQAGVDIPVLLDQRTAPPEALLARAAELGIPVLTGRRITGVSGRSALSGVSSETVQGTHAQQHRCDVLCTSGGWNPSVQLHSQSGARPRYDGSNACFVPGEAVQPERTIGAAAGAFSLAACLQQGLDAANEAVAALGRDAPTMPAFGADGEPALDIEADWSMAHGPAGSKTFVDFQNDVTTADIDLALRENYTSVEHVKRYTTAGMATDQGKSGNTHVIGYMAAQLGSPPGDVGTTTFRPPVAPVSFGAVGGMETGELIIPIRRTPLTPWHIRQGARMNEAGANYRRPFWYPHPGESDEDAIWRAAKAVRTSAGIYDGSPLGKFELFGPDVANLLELVYTNRWRKLEPGQGRFGLMLHEDGRLLDDGVTFRLDEQRWLMSTGTGTADQVHGHLERLLQVEFPHWQVYITPVTNHWANICVCGPKARSVLTRAGTDIDLNPEKFPFLALRTGRVAGVDAQVARVSFTGELSFEVNVRRRDALRVWEALMEAGEAYDITPVGSETSNVLRIEKGFISAGSEGDNITNPFDAGVGWVVDMDKADFIGKRTLVRDLADDTLVRQHVVGLLPEDASFVPTEGSALIQPGSESGPDFQGHVTASCYSPNLERSICLALLKNGHRRLGETIVVSGLERTVEAEVTRPVFIDPKGERMKS